MRRFILTVFLLISLTFPLVASAPKWEWPIGFSVGGGINYAYSQQKNTGETTTDVINFWRNNSLGFSAFLDMTFFMLRTDLNLGLGGSQNGSSFNFNSYALSAYFKFPSVFSSERVWLYFPTIGVEWELAFGGSVKNTSQKNIYNNLYVMFGLSADLEVWKENFFLKPSFLVGINTLNKFPEATAGSGFKILMGVEFGWRFYTYRPR